MGQEASLAGSSGASPLPQARSRIADLGKILVDSQGRTLYLFKKDSGTTSACTGACATAWPPLRTSGKPIVRQRGECLAGGNHRARPTATPQATYNGHPLYLLRDGHEARRHERRGHDGVRWQLVRGVPGREAGPNIEVERRQLATPRRSKRRAPADAAPGGTARSQGGTAPQTNGIPQNGGGDGDADNNGGPDDGDGGV